MSSKSKTRAGLGRIGGGSSLALSYFLESAFSRIENLGSTSTTARRKMRLDLSWHLGDAVARLNGVASQKTNIVAARWATENLAALAVTCTHHLREIAIRDKPDMTQRCCAGEALARIYVGLAKHDATLAAKSSAYRDRKATITKRRKDVLVPGPIGKIVQEELKRAEQYRVQLLVLRRLVGKKWRRWAPRVVPKEYWAAVKLPDFSVASELEWWKFLWSFIRKKIDVSKMLPLKLREYDTVRISRHSRRGKWPECSAGEKKNRRRYDSDLQKACRDHLKSLARLCGSEKDYGSL